MKKLSLLSLAIALIFGLSSCRHGHKHMKERTIEVTGSAEKEVTPDEVYYTVTLTEYMKGKTKIEMPELENRFMKKAEAAGAKKEDIQVQNQYMYDYWYSYYYKHRRDNYFASKTFEIKLSKPEMIEKLMGGEDSLNYTSASISRFDNSNKHAYRDTLKIQALKAARKKAEMLLSSIGEELGPVITITEIESPQENYLYYPYFYGGNLASNENNVSSSETAQQGNTANFKDMKLRYEMKVVFEIK
jgi:uncharacterized protein YggE